MMTKKVVLTSKLGKKFSTIFNITRKMSSDQSDVIIQNVRDKGVIILNRPKALNALNISMVRKIYPVLKEWEDKKTLVIVKGAGEKAFCAGGDVKSVVEAAIKGDKSVGQTFFKEEYITNGLIGAYKIPYIAFIDGIVMGGGVGLSVHGKYRIATERSLFAMPEMQIGLFPDVGGSYFLPRLSGRLGLYLALTGHRLKGADVLKAGIATHLCESNKLNELEEALLNCSNEQDIITTLNNFSKPDNADFSLTSVMEKINQCFSANSIEEILVRLEKDGSIWAENTIKLLSKMSPTSLKITFKELELGQKLNLQDCLQMEYRLAYHCLEHKDFLEGVRALLIDKDQNPKWDPPSLSEVTQDIIEKHFSDVPEEQELKNKL
ncbi:3-hydroxyisobutyryl-CoA hydrolase, mitochondrial isoform X1 [Anoplophora glabripennis]|uniref:3-hydroxyisobutyryl-CoA hydrolase, mitochondrial isoform X1 n=2 Tax=Anoplophora glabripennis TaxID=217634 RepID=UPI0008743708|nr:3-hydroxyisobutyryl-CoA hydrolase, mitochondrial isoform X1 [Anoplophora glabripennis]